MAKKQKELDGHKMSTGTRVIVAIFAIVMALSMMLPSLAPIFASGSTTEESQQEESSANNEESEKKDEEKAKEPESNSELDKIIATVPDNSTLKSYAEQYDKSNEPFLASLKENKNDLAALLNLGQNYMSWGSSAISSASTDEEKAYSEALLKKAMEYYDRYLAIRDSDAVKVSRAACDYYLGNTDQAMKSLEDMTKAKNDMPLAWAYLGMFREQSGDNDKAKEAYAKAVETDPNDEYGVKSYAEERVKSINEAETNFSGHVQQDLLNNNGSSSSSQSNPLELLKTNASGSSGMTIM